MHYALSPDDKPEQHDRRVGLRLPASLYAAVERQAEQRGLPLSSFVRTALQREVGAF